MILSFDHAAQELLKHGYIRRLEKPELYDYALKAQTQISDYFAPLGAQAVFDTDVQIVGMRAMSAHAIQARAEGLKADSAPGLYGGRALSFVQAVVLWFFRKELDQELDTGEERKKLTLDEVMRGVAAYYPAHMKENEEKFTRDLAKTLGFLTNADLLHEQNSPRGQVWSAHAALRVALGAEEIEDFTRQIIEALERPAQQEGDGEDEDNHDAQGADETDAPDGVHPRAQIHPSHEEE